VSSEVGRVRCEVGGRRCEVGGVRWAVRGRRCATLHTVKSVPCVGRIFIAHSSWSHQVGRARHHFATTRAKACNWATTPLWRHTTAVRCEQCAPGVSAQLHVASAPGVLRGPPASRRYERNTFWRVRQTFSVQLRLEAGAPASRSSHVVRCTDAVPAWIMASTWTLGSAPTTCGSAPTMCGSAPTTCGSGWSVLVACDPGSPTPTRSTRLRPEPPIRARGCPS
jgi:hypothetical protein